LELGIYANNYSLLKLLKMPDKNQGGANGGRGSSDKREETTRKGGEDVSKDREHMTEIGKKGGESSSGGNKGSNRGGGNQGGSGNQGGRGR
jgi:hypothetical protein